MNLVEPIPEFAKFYSTYLRRTEWGDFPDVVIHSDEPAVKKHPSYAAAKARDADAAQTLVLETATIVSLMILKSSFLVVDCVIAGIRSGKIFTLR